MQAALSQPSRQIALGSDSAMRHRVWKQRIAAAAVVLPIICVVLVLGSVTLLPAVLGWRPLVVTSASMTPTVPVGAVVVVNPARRADLQVGDIGTYQDPASGLRVTHRVIGVTTDPSGVRLLQTKGDATQSIDAPRRPEQVVGKVMYWVPYVGYVPYYVNNSTTRVPLVVGILVLSAILLLRSVIRGASAAATGPETAAAPEAAHVVVPVTLSAPVEPAGAAQTNVSTDQFPLDQPSTTQAPAAAPGQAAKSAPPRSGMARLVDGVAVAAGLVALGLAAAVFAPLAFDLHPVAMADGAMAPAIPQGALVIAEKVPVTALRSGDVVVYAPAQEHGRVLIRRVAAVDGPSSAPRDLNVTTRGDALGAADPYTIDGTQSVGRMVFAIPLAGRVLSLAGQRQGFLMLGAVVVGQMLFRATRRARPGVPA